MGMKVKVSNGRRRRRKIKRTMKKVCLGRLIFQNERERKECIYMKREIRFMRKWVGGFRAQMTIAKRPISLAYIIRRKYFSLIILIGNLN